ncbi:MULTISPECIES: helix-turn-helix domain-containing protein [Metabacillus]|uniref:helix-turn-helix domain-containing protein n=1 Tax=Metabacillus TaxID=2675233 RepID=UPI000C80AE71|nr:MULTISPECIES: helix-turn-helix transcriptional regulator [Metabacillus]MCM3443975.1 helix-turn-helix domain-containing protein [Metabacillus halosaccharovorans]PMC34970.1 hypothetical protein CJ195_20910 [Bacillus sp. UMB0899]
MHLNIIGKDLKLFREENNLTIKEFAKITNLDFKKYKRIEGSIKKVDLITLSHILSTFKIEGKSLSRLATNNNH